jgi:Raf kinase inhibitor-like YbhB/YbcL family protein
MQLESTAFTEGSKIPAIYTCDGEDTSPPLHWSDPPKGTRSFVLLCDDPDAPGGTWHHWAAYDISGHTRALAKDAARHALKQGFKQAVNDFRRADYGGPCPPRLHGLHHYRFRLLALSVAGLPVEDGCSCTDVEREANKHLLQEEVLTGVYER